MSKTKHERIYAHNIGCQFIRFYPWNMHKKLTNCYQHEQVRINVQKKLSVEKCKLKVTKCEATFEQKPLHIFSCGEQIYFLLEE